MKNKLRELQLNMPDSSNRLFVFDENNKIMKSKKIADKNARNAILYYKLILNIQNSIEEFLNPKAI